jgi:hypothetical protein
VKRTFIVRQTPSFAKNTANGKTAAGKEHTRQWWEPYLDREVVLQSKSGVLFEGVFKGFEQGKVFMEKATVRGKHTVARVPFLHVESGSWSHIHPVPASLEERSATLPQHRGVSIS